MASASLKNLSRGLYCPLLVSYIVSGLVMPVKGVKMSGYTFLMVEFKKFFAKRMREARLAKGFTQGRLAEICGLPVNALTKYENEVVVPSLETLKKLAEALEVSTDYFVFDHAKMEGLPRINDPALYEKYFVLEHLSEEDRGAAMNLLDALIARQRFREVATSHAQTPSAPEKKQPHKAAHA
jgi:transcriptional regulator with XRE-family HTH domain